MRSNFGNEWSTFNDISQNGSLKVASCGRQRPDRFQARGSKSRRSLSRFSNVRFRPLPEIPLPLASQLG
jgi:hypothetical protein